MLDLALSLSMTIISQCNVHKAISGGKFEDSRDLFDNAQGEIFDHITCSWGDFLMLDVCCPKEQTKQIGTSPGQGNKVSIATK